MLAAVLFVVIASPGSRSQGIGGTAKSSAGNEFWIAFPGNFTGANQIFLYIIATGPASVTVDFASAALGAPFSQTFLLTAAGQVQQVILPSIPAFTPAQSADILINDVVQHKGIHITSTGAAVQVYGFSNAAQTADAFLALPVNVLSTRYIVASYPSTGTTTDSGSEFVVVGTEPGTNVTITPTATINGVRVAGTPYPVPGGLGPGDTWA